MPERFDIERANAFFGRVTAAIARRRLLVAAISLAAVAFLASGLPGLVIDTSQESWFMEGDNALADKRRYEAIFGKGDNCVILARADDLLSPEKLSLLRSLSMALEAEVPYADQALSLTDFELIKGVEGGVEIASLVPDDPMSLSPEGLKTLADEVLSRDMWRNLLLSEDKRESLVSLRLKPTDPNAAPGRHHQDYLIGEKALEVIGRPEYAPLSPVASGIPVIDVEKRRYFASLTPGLIGMSVLIIALAMAVATRDPRAVLFPLAASVAALLSVFGFEGHLGVSLDPTTVFLPAFWPSPCTPATPSTS